MARLDPLAATLDEFDPLATTLDELDPVFARLDASDPSPAMMEAAPLARSSASTQRSRRRPHSPAHSPSSRKPGRDTRRRRTSFPYRNPPKKIVKLAVTWSRRSPPAGMGPSWALLHPRLLPGAGVAPERLRRPQHPLRPAAFFIVLGATRRPLVHLTASTRS